MFGRRRRPRNPKGPHDVLRGRITLVSGLICLALVLLASRLAWVFIRNGPELANRAVIQRGMHLPLELPRGGITDRNGTPLTDQARRDAVAVFPGLVPRGSRASVAITLGGILGRPPGDIMKRLESGEPAVIGDGTRRSVKNALSKAGIPGVTVVGQRSRYLPGAPATHVVGYVRAADNEGVAGIEAVFDDVLRQGKARTLTAVVDGARRMIPGLGLRVRGGGAGGKGLAQVSLTIDEGIQSRLEEAMSTVVKGAGVVLDPRTGEVLAMVSKPSFNPSDVAQSLSDPAKPLVNRAISAYFPGSVFKIVTAALALETGAVDPDRVFHDPGYFQLTPSRRIKCSKRDGHGDITFIEALAKSCNTVFIEEAIRLGAEGLVGMARTLGFGSSTGIGLPGEEAGSLPNPGECTLGDMANMALGQNGVQATPLQAAVMMACIANDGILVKPRIVKGVTDARGRRVEGYPKDPEPRQAMSKSTARYLRYALEKAVDEGTGKEAKGVWGGAAGKTGTAQTGRRNGKGEPVSHAWFVGYAPRLTPQYVAAILVEDGGAGGEVGAPVFAGFMDSLRR